MVGAVLLASVRVAHAAYEFDVGRAFLDVSVGSIEVSSEFTFGDVGHAAGYANAANCDTAIVQHEVDGLGFAQHFAVAGDI